jgi:DNA-binding CsgD family transcriptional regulator
LADPSETLIDHIYEAAALPEQWPTVLDQLSSFADCDGGLLFAVRGGLQRWVGSGTANEVMQEYIADDWPSRTDRAARLFAARHAGFLNDLDVYSRQEIDREPVFEFLRSRGLGWGVATAIPAPSGDMIAVDLERRFSRGPVERNIIRRLDRLRPHLARAALLSARLSLERVRATAAVLDLVGLPAIVLGGGGKPLAANQRLERLMPHVVRARRSRLEIVNGAADALFANAVARVSDEGDADCVRSIPVPATESEPPIVMHLIPVRGSAADVFSGAAAVLVVTPVLPKEVPTAEVLQGLFDLTPAEARVARAVAERQTIRGIAGALQLSPETIRSQLKSVLAKTGTPRQVDLAALLAGAGPPGAC